MQPLKILVIVMSVLILAGVVVVAVTVANRLTKPASHQDTGEGGAAPRGFGSADLPIPHGCRVEGLHAAGERLIVQLAGGAGCNRILVVDVGTGRLLGRLDLVEAP